MSPNKPANAWPAYLVHGLRVRFAADAVADATEGLASTGLFLLGEQHQQRETPRAIYTLMRRLDIRGLALEWESDLRPLVDAFLAEGVDASVALSEDGRITEGHFALLARLRDERRLERLILMDETARDWTGHWTERDAGMARTLLRERDPAVPTLVVAGGFHTTLGGDDEPTMASLVDRNIPGVPNGVLEYATTARREGRFRRDRTGRYVFALPGETP
jgi:hypothetical protein